MKPHCRASTAVTSMRHFSAQILASPLIPRIKGAWERMTTSTNCGEFTGNFIDGDPMVNLVGIYWWFNGDLMEIYWGFDGELVVIDGEFWWWFTYNYGH